MDSIQSTFLRYVDVYILYQDCTATVKQTQVLVKQAVFESAAIAMESRDSFPGKFPLALPAFACVSHNAILCTTSSFKMNSQDCPCKVHDLC